MPETSTTSNVFTHLFHAFTAAPGFQGTVVRDGVPRVVDGATVVVGIDAADEHAVREAMAAQVAMIRKGERVDIPLRTVNHADTEIRDTHNAQELWCA